MNYLGLHYYNQGTMFFGNSFSRQVDLKFIVTIEKYLHDLILLNMCAMKIK